MEPPYGIIWTYLRTGRIVPFLGAGASTGKSLGNPTTSDSSPPSLPTGGELAAMLADESSFPGVDSGGRRDLAKVSSFYQECDTRAGLLNRLRHVFARDYAPGSIHQFLAELDLPLLIVTTNYDSLIEKAFHGKPYHLVIHPTDDKALGASVLWWKPGSNQPEAHPPKSLPLSLTDTTIIYKMHGGLSPAKGDWAGCVITEEDYVDFLSRMATQAAIPARFMLHFRTCRFLFLGYGLADWNFRVMLKNLGNALAEPEPEQGSDNSDRPASENEGRSWAVQASPSELEEILWRTRRVNIYDLRIEDFVLGMREWRRKNPALSVPCVQGDS
jgi:hypothetical protein